MQDQLEAVRAQRAALRQQLAERQRQALRGVVLAGSAGRNDRHRRGRRAPSLGGLRNVLVHNYLEVDPEIVVAAVPLALEQYGVYVAQAARFLERHTV